MSAVDAVTAPLDLARRTALGIVTRSPWLTRVVARRRSRVAALGAVQVTSLFAVAVLAPVALFFVGPLVLGVPHLAADTRYLVLRRRLPRTFVAVSAVSAVVIVSVRLAALFGLLRASADGLEVAAGGLWMLSALAFGVHDKRTALRALPLLPVIGVGAMFALSHPHGASIGMMHIHNVIGVLAWALLYPKKKVWELVPVLAVCIAVAVIASGAAAAWTYRSGGDLAFGTRLTAIATWLAPGFRPKTAVSIAIAFVFLQAVHYAIWLTWIPQEDLSGEGTPTFRMTVRGLVADFGALGTTLVVAATAGLLALATVRLADAFNAYLTLSRFHGLLELSVIGLLYIRGRGLAPEGTSTARVRPSTVLAPAGLL